MTESMLITVVGAITGLVTAIVTSFLIPIFQKRQEKVEQRRSIHERYAQPLAADAVNLLWRLDEILFKGRAQYLREDAPRTPFNQYKLISTCYRIAAVLGWIRAIKLEQSYLFYGEQSPVEDLRKAVVDFESALADGPHVEEDIFRKLAHLWNIQLPKDLECIARLATQAVADMQYCLEEHKLMYYSEFQELNEEQQLQVSKRICSSITQGLGFSHVPEPVLVSACGQAMAILSVKQAWVYRDWQQAIGDSMIREIDGAVRKYDIMGYGTFESLFAGEDSSRKTWIDRLQAVIVGIDSLSPPPNDFRLEQLRNVARAVAALVCAIERLDLDRRILDPKACELARKFLDAIKPRMLVERLARAAA